MCDIWFIRFATNADCTLLVCGNRTGKLYVYNLSLDALAVSVKLKNWSMQQQHPYFYGLYNPSPLFTMSHPNSKVTVRQVAISADDRVILAVAEDGKIWRWDKEIK
jgi:hypothetical protein